MLKHIYQWRQPIMSWKCPLRGENHEPIPEGQGGKSGRGPEHHGHMKILTCLILPNFPLRLKLSHKEDWKDTALIYRVRFRGGVCSQVTPLAPRNWRGITRLWACSKQVKKGSPITSIIAGEKLETKLEISMKIEVNHLRGLTLGRWEWGKHFQWQLQ